MLGRTAAMLGGGVYTKYHCLPATACIGLPEGTTPLERASMIANPLTALAMTETIWQEAPAADCPSRRRVRFRAQAQPPCLADCIGLVDALPLAEALRPENCVTCAVTATGRKFISTPSSR